MRVSGLRNRSGKRKRSRLGTLIARTSHYLFARDLRYRSQRAVQLREYFFFWKSKVNRSRAIEPRIERIFFLEISRFKVNHSQRKRRFFWKLKNFANDLEAKFYFAEFLVLSMSFLLSIWFGKWSILEFF